MIATFDRSACGQTKILNFRAMPQRVDRDAHVIEGMAVIQAVEALGHGLLVDQTTLEQIADFGNASAAGIKSRFTHPGLSADGLGRHLGRMKNFRIIGDKVLADLHFAASAANTPEGDLRSYVEQLAAEDPEAAGLSIVAHMAQAWKLDDGEEIMMSKAPDGATTKLPFARLHMVRLDGGEMINPLRAVDLVDEPAANRTGMFSAGTTNGLAELAFAEMDKWRDMFGNIDPTDMAMEFAHDHGIDDEKKVAGFIRAFDTWRVAHHPRRPQLYPAAINFSASGGAGTQTHTKTDMENVEPTPAPPKTFTEADIAQAIDAALAKRDEEIKLAHAAEKERVAAITALGHEHDLADLANDAITSESSVDAFAAVVIASLAADLAEARKDIAKLEKLTGKSPARAALTSAPDGEKNEVDALLDRLNATRDPKERYSLTTQIKAARKSAV